MANVSFKVRPDATIVAVGVVTEYGSDAILAVIGGELGIFDAAGNAIDGNDTSLIAKTSSADVLAQVNGRFLNVYEDGCGRHTYQTAEDARGSRRLGRPNHRVVQIVEVPEFEAFLNVYDGNLGNNVYDSLYDAFYGLKDGGITVALVPAIA